MAQNNTAAPIYHSGQGVVFLSDTVNGVPTGFRNIGNVAELKITLETTELEHKESTTGARAIDLTITTENKVTVSVTAESITGENLRIALFGTTFEDPGGSVTDELRRATHGKTSITNHLNISAVTVDRTAAGTFVFDTVIATDALVIDSETYTAVASGAIRANKEFNIGADDEATIDDLVLTINAQTSALTYEAYNLVATTDTLTVFAVTPGDGGNSLVTTTPDTTITPGAATFLLGGAATVTTDYLVNAEVGSILIVDGGGIPDVEGAGSNIHIDYTFAAHTTVQAFNAGKTNQWLRFEGVNTARGNKPVVVNIFKFSPKPLNEQSLIGDGITQIVMEGTALADTTRPAGQSQFFEEHLDNS